jgi:hypothetical protein
MALSVLSSVWTGHQETGDVRLYGVGTHERYRIARRSDLHDIGFAGNISSVTAFGSPGAETTMILFANISGLTDYPSFTGIFEQVTNPKGADESLTVDLSHDNATASLLLVAARRKPEVRISFRDRFLDTWTSMLDDHLSGSPAHRKGDPTLTWKMFPRNVEHLHEERMYLVIHQDLDIELDGWADYVAWIQYYIHLRVNASGNLRAKVHRWEYWVESGVKADDIGDALEPKVDAGADTLNSELASALSAFDGTGFEGLYFLPGRQLGKTTPAHLEGTTWDDVTIVLET